MTSILDSIDGALRDWETSHDAMRWSPRLAEVKQRAVADAPPALAPALRPGLSLTGPGGPWIPVGSFADGAMVFRHESASAMTAVAEAFALAAQGMEGPLRALASRIALLAGSEPIGWNVYDGSTFREFIPNEAPGVRDEFDDYLREQMEDPEFRAAYEAEVRRLRRAWLGYGGLPVNGREYQRRLRCRRKRRRR